MMTTMTTAQATQKKPSKILGDDVHSARLRKVCPLCESSKIQRSGMLTLKDDTVELVAYCNECTAYWIEEFKTSAISGINGGSVSIVQYRYELEDDPDLRMAQKFEDASWGKVSITDEDFEALGIKKQKTYKGLNERSTGPISLGSWEGLCIYVFEKLSGKPHPGCVAMGRGFRSREAAKPIVQFLRERAGLEDR